MLKKMLKSVLPIALVIAMLFSQSAFAATVGIYELSGTEANMQAPITDGVKADDTFAVVVTGAQSNEMVTILIYEDADADSVFDENETILYIWQTTADENGDASFTVALPTNVTESVKAVAIGTQNNATSTYAATTEFEVVPDVVYYTVTWVNDDDSVLETDTNVVAGTTPSYDGETPTKAGDAQYSYTFVGWTPEIAAVADNVTYKATYTQTVNKYTVKFVDEDGTELKSEELEYGATPVAPADPTKAATPEYTYTFAGWDVDVVAVTGEATYTATYTSAKNKYTVTFVDWNDEVISTQEVEYGSAAIAPEDPTREADAQYTYTFEGWDVAYDNITAATTVKATYDVTVNEYTITFVDEDGTELQSGKVAYGETPAYTGETPAKDATAQYTYTFDGWTTELVPVTGEATYTAKYSSTVNEYTITFVDEDGETVLDTQTVAYGEVPVYAGETPAKDATAQYTYTFAGWNSELAEVTGNATYKATYTQTVNKYTVKFVDEDGTELKSEELEYGATPVAPADPTKAATPEYTYTFAGWDVDVVAVTGEATYTATYTSAKNKYTVTFVDWNDEVISTQEVEYGSAAIAPEDPTREADAQYTYTFEGWDVAYDNITAATTVKATYDVTVNEYTITFVDEDGAELQSGKVAYGETPAYTGETPAKDATAQYTYTFAGWTPEIAEVTGDATYTATFTETVNEYTITWIVDGVSETETYAYGATPEKADPTKAEDDDFTYTFKGWTPAIVAVTGDATYTAEFDAVAKTKYFTASFGDAAEAIEKAENAEDFTIELPTPANAEVFAGWRAGETFLPAGAEYELTADVTFAAVYVDLTMVNAAAIRLDKANPGLRFTTNGTKIDGAEYGTLLALDEALSTRGFTDATYTIEDIQTFNGNAENKTLKCANVKANYFYDEEPMDYRTVMIVDQNDNNATMYGYKWAARSYVTVKYSNNEAKTFYSNIVKRSPEEVAEAALANGTYTGDALEVLNVYAGN